MKKTKNESDDKKINEKDAEKGNMPPGRNANVLRITYGAVIAAVYVVLTVVFAPISFGPMQVRIPPIISNALIVPFVLKYGYGFTEIPLPLMMVYIAIGEIIGCYILGEILGGVLLKNRSAIFSREI